MYHYVSAFFLSCRFSMHRAVRGQRGGAGACQGGQGGWQRRVGLLPSAAWCWPRSGRYRRRGGRDPTLSWCAGVLRARGGRAHLAGVGKGERGGSSQKRGSGLRRKATRREPGGWGDRRGMLPHPRWHPRQKHSCP